MSRWNWFAADRPVHSVLPFYDTFSQPFLCVCVSGYNGWLMKRLWLCNWIKWWFPAFTELSWMLSDGDGNDKRERDNSLGSLYVCLKVLFRLILQPAEMQQPLFWLLGSLYFERLVCNHPFYFPVFLPFVSTLHSAGVKKGRAPPTIQWRLNMHFLLLLLWLMLSGF